MCTVGIPCRESAGTRPVALKVVPVTGAAFSGFTMNPFFVRLFFRTPTVIMVCIVVDMCDAETSIGGRFLILVGPMLFP